MVEEEWSELDDQEEEKDGPPPPEGRAGLLVLACGGGEEDLPHLPGVAVEVWDEDWNVLRGTTDGDGKARFDLPPGVDVAVAGRFPGRIRACDELRGLREGATRVCYLFLFPAFELKGVVLSAIDGVPVSGAVVRAFDESFFLGCCPPMHSRVPPLEEVVTDAAGAFTLHGGSRSGRTVTVDAPGWLHGEFSMHGGETILRLDPGSSLGGRVTTPDGTAAAGARVLAIARADWDLGPGKPLGGLDRKYLEFPDGWWGSSYQVWQTLRTTAGDGGEYLLPGLDPGAAYHVYAVGPDGASSEVATDVVAPGAGGTVRRDFRLRRPASLLVRLEGEAGATPEALKVELAGEGLTCTDPDRRPWLTRFGALPPGDYRLEIHGNTTVPVAMGLSLKEGEQREITVFLDDGAVLEGRVVDDAGTPVTGATVTLRPKEVKGERRDWDEKKEAVTDGEGRFRLQGLAARTHLLDVHGAGVRLRELPVDPPGDALGVVAPRLGGFRLRLVRPEGEEGPFELRHEVGYRFSSGGSTTTVSQTSFDGGRNAEFSEDGLYGTVTFLGEVYGFAPVARSIEIVPGRIVDLGDIPLLRGGVFSGVVRYGPEDPAEGIRIYAEDPETRKDLGSATTDSQGAFSLEHLPPGPVRVIVRNKASVLLEQTFESGGVDQTVSWTVDQPGWLEAVVVEEDGTPAPNVSLILTDEKGQSVSDGGLFIRTTGKDGKYETLVPRGTLAVRLVRRGQTVNAGTISVGKGQTVTARFTLPAREE